eukprot:5185417-Pyramimonas_sp.AAC.1
MVNSTVSVKNWRESWLNKVLTVNSTGDAHPIIDANTQRLPPTILPRTIWLTSRWMTWPVIGGQAFASWPAPETGTPITTDQSDAGRAGIFPRRTNRTQGAR